MRTNTSCHGDVINRYRNGVVTKTKAAATITGRLPMMSRRMPVCKLRSIPTIVEATVATGTPRERINSRNAGFFAMVELKIGKQPKIHRSKKAKVFYSCQSPAMFLIH